MKIALKWIVVLGAGFLAAQASAEEPQPLTTPQDKESYCIGVNMARNFKQQGVEVEVDALVRGLKDGFSGEKLLLSDAELVKITTRAQSDLRRKQVQIKRVATMENKARGDAFLAENKAKEGVVSLPSGLQYKILKMGDGKTPTETDTVECNYRGTLIDGTEFDSSSHGGQPAVLKVSGVIPGWREALKLMPVGSKWQLFIPPQLAYGAQRSGTLLGPNSTLIFEVELLGVRKAQEAELKP